MVITGSGGDGGRYWYPPWNRDGGGGAGGSGGRKKRPRLVYGRDREASTFAVIVDPDERPRKPAFSGHAAASSSVSAPVSTGGFDDSSTADVLLRLYYDKSLTSGGSDSDPVKVSDLPDVELYLHSAVLRRAKYFEALLSDRWQKNTNPSSSSSNPSNLRRLNLGVSPNYESFEWHYIVLKLLYANDVASSINDVSIAIGVLPVALELLFEDCVKACLEYIEAVPWTEEEEKKVMSLVPLLSEDESQQLIARVLPAENTSSEEMLHGLIMSAIHTYSGNLSQAASAKAFVSKLLSDYSSREMAKRVLDRAFLDTLQVVKDSLEKYSSPVIRGDQNETEALQRLDLHAAMTSGRHLYWLIERMIELRVADTAVKEWSDMGAFTANLRRAFYEDAWKNIVPGLPTQVLRCTNKLANAVATGNILAPKQVRMGLVKDWLPVMIISRDKVSSMSNNASLNLDLEEAFLKIISTLPLSDSQSLLQNCLIFSSKNIEDCPHLVNAFTTWFRRANQAYCP